MQFVIKDKGLESDTGFWVHRLNRFQEEYREGDYTVTVEVEALDDGRNILIYLGALKYWDPPHEREPIGTQEKERLRVNFTAAYKFRGIQAQFDMDL